MADLSQLGKKAEVKVKEWLDRPEDGYCFDRIPDQMNGFFGSSNICDFTLFKAPSFYYLESKSTWNDRFDFSMLTEKQHNSMLEKAQISGVTCYVVVLFATYQEAYLLDIRDIKIAEEQGVKSINIKKRDKWITPYIKIRTIPSRKQLLDYDPKHADEIF